MHHYIFVLFVIVAHFSNGFCLENKTDFKEPPKETVKRQARIGAADFLSCYIAKDLSCFFDIGDRWIELKRTQLLAQEKFEGRATGQNPTDLSNAIAKIFTELSDVFKDGFLGFFRTAKEGDDSEIEEKPNSHVGEARKKKKKGKLLGLIKLLILGIVLKALITLKLKALSAALQVKFFLVALAGLLLNAARFYLDLKKGHQPQKVIYYEHAQHQHHYDGAEEDWSAGGSSPGGGYWGRAYDEDPQSLAYAKQKATTSKSWLG